MLEPVNRDQDVSSEGRELSLDPLQAGPQAALLLHGLGVALGGDQALTSWQGGLTSQHKASASRSRLCGPGLVHRDPVQGERGGSGDRGGFGDRGLPSGSSQAGRN